MKIEIEINEEKILELAQSSSMEDLPRIILSQARQEAINVCVNEIKNKISEREYYSSKEVLQQDVRDNIFEQLKESINRLISDRFDDVKIKNIIDQKFNGLINEWINKKLEEKLEEAKADIMFVRQSDIEAGEYNN